MIIQFSRVKDGFSREDLIKFIVDSSVGIVFRIFLICGISVLMLYFDNYFYFLAFFVFFLFLKIDFYCHRSHVEFCKYHFIFFSFFSSKKYKIEKVNLLILFI
jgi:hypothetical protein